MKDSRELPEQLRLNFEPSVSDPLAGSAQVVQVAAGAGNVVAVNFRSGRELLVGDSDRSLSEQAILESLLARARQLHW